MVDPLLDVPTRGHRGATGLAPNDRHRLNSQTSGHNPCTADSIAVTAETGSHPGGEKEKPTSTVSGERSDGGNF